MATRPSGSAFRKKGTVLTPGAPRSPSPTSGPGLSSSGAAARQPAQQQPYQPSRPAPALQPAPGVRPSPIDGRPTTSTGTASLDGILAGHGGLALGTSLLLGEEGTTDFAGVLLRYYAAEGLVQGHAVHIVGAREPWLEGLPGLAVEPSSSSSGGGESRGPRSTTSSSSGSGGGGGGVGARGPPAAGENLKIAWRYSALAGGGLQGRGSWRCERYDHPNSGKGLTCVAEPRSNSGTLGLSEDGPVYCHAFDLTQRLKRASIRGQTFIYPRKPSQGHGAGHSSSGSSLEDTVIALTEQIRNSPPTTIHRIVVNSLLSPGLHDRPICEPHEVLRFLHILRAALRTFSNRTSAMVSMPLFLHPRSSGLVRWMEILCDGSMQLIPLPRSEGLAADANEKDGISDGKMQGVLRVHSLPIYHEKGGGASVPALEGDLSFSLSRTSGLVIQPLSLPPLSDERDDAMQGPSKPPEEF